MRVVARHGRDNHCVGARGEQFDIRTRLAAFPVASGVAALMRGLRRGRFIERWNTRTVIGIVADGASLGMTMLTHVRFGYVGRRMVTVMFCRPFRTAMHVMIATSKDTVSQNVERGDGGDKFVCERHGAKRFWAQRIFTVCGRRSTLARDNPGNWYSIHRNYSKCSTAAQTATGWAGTSNQNETDVVVLTTKSWPSKVYQK
jgi:hypothetical protein